MIVKFENMLTGKTQEMHQEEQEDGSIMLSIPGETTIKDDLKMALGCLESATHVIRCALVGEFDDEAEECDCADEFIKDMRIKHGLVDA